MQLYTQNLLTRDRLTFAEPWLGLKVLYEGARHAPMTFDLNPIYMVTPVEHTRQPFHISRGRQRIHIYTVNEINNEQEK